MGECGSEMLNGNVGMWEWRIDSIFIKRHLVLAVQTSGKKASLMGRSFYKGAKRWSFRNWPSDGDLGMGKIQ
jgi:hypothetical protein